MQRLEREEVLEVVSLYRQGWGVTNIADQMALPEATLERILNGTHYKSITGGRIMNGKRPKSELAMYRKGTEAAS